MAPRDENGKAGITNGKIVVINPQEGGRPAVLCPPEDGVEIFVNGKRVEEAVELREEDQIEVNSLVFTEEAQIQVKVSPDGLYASLAVSPQITTSFSLKEAEMTASLKPEVCKNEVREKVCTLAAAEAELRKNKVTFGLDFAALKEIVEKAEGQFQIVARGEKAKNQQLEDPHMAIFNALQGWLCNNNTSSPYPAGANLLEAIIKGDRKSYQHAQAESLAYLEWYKKFAVAFLKKA
jgi:hypothetical protein